MPEPRCCSSRRSERTVSRAAAADSEAAQRAPRSCCSPSSRIAAAVVRARHDLPQQLGRPARAGRRAPAAGRGEHGDGSGGAQPAPLPEEIRGVHVTAALASLDGKLDEYLALADSGLTALELDVKDENGEVGFERQAPPLARAVGAARPFYNPRQAARAAEEAGRLPDRPRRRLRGSRPRHAAAAARHPAQRGGGVWTNSAGLAWTNPHNKRVWKYNVDIAVAAAKAGFDEIMFDYVRFPTDGDLLVRGLPGQA